MTPYLHALEDSTGLPEPALDPLVVLPMRDEALRYAIGIPSGWEMAKDMGEVVDAPHIQRPIGAFCSGDLPYGQALAVTSTPMPTAVRVEDWVRRLCERSGRVVLDQRWHETSNGPRLVTWSLRDRVLQATVAFADCGRVLMTHCMGGVGNQPSIATTVWRTALPMHLVQPGGDGRLEARTSHCGSGVVHDLPNSWKPEDAKGEDTVASITDWHRREAVATVRVRLAAEVPEPLEARRQRTLARLWHDGWRTSHDLSDPGIPGPDCPPGWEIRDTEVNLPHKGLALLRIAHGECHGRGVEIVATCEPGREFLWMRTTRAVEVAIASARLSD